MNSSVMPVTTLSDQLLENTSMVFGQMEYILQQLTHEQMVRPLPLLHKATIGQHTRHILEYFLCTLDSVDCGCLDFNNRIRKMELENDKIAVAMAKETILCRLQEIDFSKPIPMVPEFFFEGMEVQPMIATTMARELMYAFEHALHHLAIMRLGIEQHFPEVLLPENLGVAPSTIKYRNQKQ